MSSRSARNPVTPDPAALVGRAIVASIAEPWDFISTAGDNALVGRIVAVSGSGAPVEWIICEVSPFDSGGVTVSSVVAVRRYAGEEPIEQLRRRGEAHVQLLYDPTGAPLTAARVAATLRAGQGNLKHLVGALRVAGG